MSSLTTIVHMVRMAYLTKNLSTLPVAHSNLPKNTGDNQCGIVCCLAGTNGSGRRQWRVEGGGGGGEGVQETKQV